MSAELDQCRREFEATMREQFPQASLICKEDGSYLTFVDGVRWATWQAAWNRRTPQEAAQPELVAEVVRDDEEGVQYVQWFKPRELFPVGTQLYTSPSSLSTEDRELMERAAEMLDCMTKGYRFGDSETKLLAALRTRLSQSRRKG